MSKPQLHPDLKPIAYRSRKRQVLPSNKHWYKNRYWYWQAFEEQCNPAVTLEEKCEPLSEEERQAHMRRMLDAGM